MSPGILGKKIGMSQVFRPDGQAVPVTLLKAGPCMVVQRKTPTTDGYDAVQLGLVEFIKPKRDTHQDWSKYEFVLCCGPRLITDGIPYVEPWTEGFKDKHMLNRNGRLAVGATADNHLVFVATRHPVYLSKLAKAMRGALGDRYEFSDRATSDRDAEAFACFDATKDGAYIVA